MKGTPEQPMCGFSARAAGALQAVGVPFAAVDILPDPRIRQELSAISNWPTTPQLFVDGELIGGSDIVVEMFEAGVLDQGPRAAAAAQGPQAPLPRAGPPEREKALVGTRGDFSGARANVKKKMKR